MKANERVYFDYAATTPVDERVLDVMMPFFRHVYGNPSSVHMWGQAAESALEDARQKTAQAIGARSSEIVFTGCGSESDNMALRGVAHAMRLRRGARHILTTPVEHHAVLHTVKQLVELEGFEADFLPVDGQGRVTAEQVRAALRPDTAIVSVIYANNEIGTVNPIDEIGAVCRDAGVPFHTDAVQAAAHLRMDVIRDQVDLLSLGAHKFYGPKGVGALYVRQGTPILPIQTGGGQEQGLRAGTQNVAFACGLAAGLEIAQQGVESRSKSYLEMRDYLIGAVLETIPEARLTGDPMERLPNHASFVFKGIDGNRLLIALDIAGYACSSGSACKTGNPQPSEVLTAIGLGPEWALGSLRVTLGADSNPEAVRDFVPILARLVEKQRESR